MAEVIIRLKRLGGKKQPHHRLVVMTKSRSRDGRTIEQLGFYDPRKNPPEVKVNLDRAKFWIDRGAGLSPTVKQLLKRAAAAQKN